MNRRIIIITVALSLLFLLLSQPVLARYVENLRAQNEKRTWIYLLDEKEFGTLESIYKGRKSFKGRMAEKYEEVLTLDYTALGQDFILNIKNDHYVDNSGGYIGDEMHAVAGEQKQELLLKRVGDSIKGRFVSNGVENPVAVAVASRIMAYDNNMVDQLEMFLGLYDIKIGDTISDTIFVPQTTTTSPIKIIVESFEPVRYGQMLDSAYQCRMLEPSEMVLFFTRDNKLVRMVHQTQKIITILKENPLERFKPRSQPYTLGSFISQAPIYFLYIIFGFIISLPVIRRYYKRPEIYLLLILGALMYPLVRFTQIPLQTWYSLDYMIPSISGGGSPFGHAFIMSLTAGVIQETLILLPLILIFFTRRPSMRSLIILGIFCGIGFGIYSAGAISGTAFQSGAMPLLSWNVFRQFFIILFHATGGAALSFGLAGGIRRLALSWVALSLIHAGWRYLVIYYQRGSIDLGIYTLIVALVAVLTVLAVYILIRRRLGRSMQAGV